ncbi:MAG: T9SS type A sorting domain-containing protein, partial [Crocinitomicaceae bacterium]
KKLIVTFIFSAFLLFANAQFGFLRSNLPVFFAGNQLVSPWGGGLNCPQFSEIDINFDGIIDLFVLDRSSDQIRIFIGKDNGVNKYFVEAPEFRSLFPVDIRYRAALVDYNSDGLPDIFTYGIGGVKVYRNIGNSIIGHQWIVQEKLLYSNQYGSIGNLYVSSSDIPAIVDVDGDGDIDVLTYQIGGQRVEYHMNMSMENYGIPDSLEFVLANECFGKFKESGSTNLINLNDTTSPCKTGTSALPNPKDGVEKHSGSTILAIDMDNSSTIDLIIGDISFPNLIMLTNGGTTPNTDSPMISEDVNFPSNSTAASVDLFPAAFWVDADFDGVKDLLASPNAKVVSANQKSVWRYKNVGTNSLPVFVYQEDAFLQKDMIDVGTGSIPILVDVNQDGLKDLLVANFYRYKVPLDKESTVYYYQNTGTASSPVFTYVDDNKFNLLNAGLGLRIVPSFADLDGDGDLDMIVGDESGSLSYYKNHAGSGVSLAFDAPQLNMTDKDGNVIDIGSYSAPFLVDLDEDGLVDMVIGTKSGKLTYYKNVGTTSNYSFQLVSSFFGAVNVSPASPEGYSVPFFTKTTNGWQLFVGAQDGKLHFYNNIEGNMTSSGVFDYISDHYLDIDMKAYSAFATSDLDNDGNLELFVGQDLGGIEYYEADPSSTLGIKENTNESKIQVYPNPANNQVTISGCSLNDEVSISNALGEVIISQDVNEVKKLGFTLNISLLDAGIYFVSIKNGLLTVQKRLVVYR